MALEDTVEIVKKQLNSLDKEHEEMLIWAERFSKLLYSKKLYDCYHAFHLLLTSFTNSLIPITPYISSEALSTSAVFPQKPLNKTENFLEKVKGFNSTVGIVVVGIISAVMFLVALQGAIPWVVPFVFLVIFMSIVFGLPERFFNFLSQRNEPDDGFSHDTDANPTEWIAKDIQVMSNKYDDIRGLIIAQNVDASQLPSSYRKVPAMVFSRAQQEREFFPTECLNVVRKIMVFCNNAYYLRKGELMAHLPGGRQAIQPSGQVQQQ